MQCSQEAFTIVCGYSSSLVSYSFDSLLFEGYAVGVYQKTLGLDFSDRMACTTKANMAVGVLR